MAFPGTKSTQISPIRNIGMTCFDSQDRSKLGLVQATSIMRTLQVGDRPTKLARAVAEVGRIDKTVHILTSMNDESKRRRTLTQLNRGEDRHSLAWTVFHGKRGELRQHYREGQEDRLQHIGLVLDVIVLWNTIYMDAALEQLRNEESLWNPEDVARLSPLIYESHQYFSVGPPSPSPIS